MKLTGDTRRTSRSPAKRHRRGRAAADDARARERVVVGTRESAEHHGHGSRSGARRAPAAGESCAAARRHHGPGPQAARYFPFASGGSERHAEHRRRARVDPRRAQPLHAVDACRRRNFPVVEEINAQQTLDFRPGRVPAADRQDAFLDGAAGRAVLPQRPAARDGGEVAARRGDRRASAGAVRDGDSRHRRKTSQQVIVPRKGVLELQRILGTDGTIELAIGTNHVRAQIGDIRFTSKLIDGRFPEYGRVIPASPTKRVEADRETLRQALQRTAILSNEKYRGIRLTVKSDLLMIQAHNPGAGRGRGPGRGRLQGRGSRDWLQCQLLAGCLERDRGRQGRDRAHRLQQQLPDSRARRRAHPVRGDADEVVSAVAAAWRSSRSTTSAASSTPSSLFIRGTTSSGALMAPARPRSSRPSSCWVAAALSARATPSG